MSYLGDRRTPGSGPRLLPFAKTSQSILLTGRASQTIVVKRQQMMRSHILNPSHCQPRWRVFACVLLIGLVVYNPFVALSGSSGNLSYEKLARNRATIGSSEMQQFSPVLNPTVQPDLDVEVKGAEPAAAVQESQPGMDQREVIFLQPELFANLWFRPPPAR
jgi:hypothetical protein